MEGGDAGSLRMGSLKPVGALSESEKNSLNHIFSTMKHDRASALCYVFNYYNCIYRNYYVKINDLGGLLLRGLLGSLEHEFFVFE